MAHHAAKQSACANCYYAFAADQPDDYCPRCGQHNEVPDLRLGHVLEEALEGFFHFDGKVWQTLKLLLFRPGELTRRFLAGQRVGFVPPIRLYVLISFVFFFVLSLTVGHQEKQEKKGMASSFTKGIKAGLTAQDSADTDKSSGQQLGDSIANSFATKEGRDKVNGTFFGFKFNAGEIERLPHELSEVQIDSTIRAKQMPLNFKNRFILRRIARWRGVPREEIIHQALRGGSILLFFLMPLTALLLKLAYFRRGRYYLSHLIFTIHVHCFIFVLLLLAQLLDLLLPNFDAGGWVMLLLFGYFVLALRRVYEQGWLKTTFKSLLLGFNYGILFLFSALGVLVLGAAIF